MPEMLQAFHFLRPWWLLGLLPLLLTWRYGDRGNRTRDHWAQVIAPHLLGAMMVRSRAQRWFNPVRVAVVMMSLGFIAVAGPAWERQPTPLFEDEAPLIIALDVSASMDQRDVQPSRLIRARQKIEDLLTLRGGSRAALLVYAGSAHRVIPLTGDPDALLHLLSAVNVQMMPRPGKLPESVLPLVARLLSESAVPGTLLLLGDGIGAATLPAVERFFAQPEVAGAQLLVLGIGTSGAPVEGADFIPLERESLQQLAAAGGGIYQEVTTDRQDVQRLARAIDNHLISVQDEELPWVDAGYWLLMPFAGLFLLWFRKGWTLQWLVVVAGATFLMPVNSARADFADWWLTPDQQGRYLFAQGDYAEAAERFEDLRWKATAYYAAEQFDLAAEYFSRDDTPSGLFNRANALAQGRHYLAAVRGYDEVLIRVPGHEGALHNRALVQAIIDEINALSAAQVAEGDETARDPGAEPRTADGAERQVLPGEEARTFTAEEILADERLQEMWLRGVQADPARFLGIKFQMQLEAAP
ncbi:MAG: VWA domain-containing protein [Pseudomonadales bacterium]